MTDNEIIGGASDALTEKAKFAIKIPITYRPGKQRTMTGLLNRILGKKEPVERELVFYPCKVANMFRIARAALQLPNEFASDNLTEAMLPIMADETNINTLMYIIAASLQNNHLEPEQELIDFLKMNMDHEDMFLCLHNTFGVLGLQSFLNSIVLTGGTVSVLKPEASPLDGRE